MMKKVIQTVLAPPERKLFVAGCTAISLLFGFIMVAYKPSALEAYKVMAEWLVYLFAAFGGANALTWWTRKGQSAPLSKGHPDFDGDGHREDHGEHKDDKKKKEEEQNG